MFSLRLTLFTLCPVEKNHRTVSLALSFNGVYLKFFNFLTLSYAVVRNNEKLCFIQLIDNPSMFSVHFLCMPKENEPKEKALSRQVFFEEILY